MNSLKCPPDYTQFSLDDFEQVYEYLRGAVQNASNVACPTNSGPGRQRPGAAFIESRHMDAALDDLASMTAYLRTLRFATKRQTTRAQRILCKYELDFGDQDDLSAVATMAAPKAPSRPRLAAA